jgi:hypothetical protein
MSERVMTADELRFVLVGELHAKGSAGEKKQQKEQKLTEKTFSKVRGATVAMRRNFERVHKSHFKSLCNVIY